MHITEVHKLPCNLKCYALFVILYRKSIGFFVYAWSLKKWISVTTVSENIMVDWTCYTLLFVVGVFFFFFFLFFFFWFCFLVFFDRWFFWGVHFCFDFWGGLYCFNFLFLHCVGFFFVFFSVFIIIIIFFDLGDSLWVSPRFLCLPRAFFC